MAKTPARTPEQKRAALAAKMKKLEIDMQIAKLKQDKKAIK